MPVPPPDPNKVAAVLRSANGNFAAKLLEISQNFRPNYVIDGFTVSHAEYAKALADAIQQTQVAAAAAQPFFIVSRV